MVALAIHCDVPFQTSVGKFIAFRRGGVQIVRLSRLSLPYNCFLRLQETSIFTILHCFSLIREYFRCSEVSLLFAYIYCDLLIVSDTLTIESLFLFTLNYFNLFTATLKILHNFHFISRRVSCRP